MRGDWSVIALGSVGGAAGTLTMSLVMMTAHRFGFLGGYPPEYIASAGLDSLGMRRRTSEAQDALAVALHVAFGTAVGAVFGLAHRRTTRMPATILQALVFGGLVWLVSYHGWIPALGILPPPERDQPGRPATMLLAHWVYGVTLGLVVALATRGAPH